VTTPEIVDKIHDVTLADRRIKVHEIAEAVRMSYERDFIFCTIVKSFFKIDAAFSQSGAKTRSSSNTS
jgi:hypothetical protein